MSTDMALWRSGLLKVIQPIAPSRSAITRGVLLNTAGVLSLRVDGCRARPAGSFLAHDEPVLVLEILQPDVVARIVAEALGVDLVQVVARPGEEGEEVLQQVAGLDVAGAVLELDEAHGAAGDEPPATAQHLQVVALGVDLEIVDRRDAGRRAVGVQRRDGHRLAALRHLDLVVVLEPRAAIERGQPRVGAERVQLALFGRPPQAEPGAAPPPPPTPPRPPRP